MLLSWALFPLKTGRYKGTYESLLRLARHLGLPIAFQPRKLKNATQMRTLPLTLRTGTPADGHVREGVAGSAVSRPPPSQINCRPGEPVAGAVFQVADFSGESRDGSTFGLDRLEGRVRRRPVFRRRRAGPVGRIRARRFRLVHAGGHLAGAAEPALLRADGRSPRLAVEHDGFRSRRSRRDVPGALVLDSIRLRGLVRLRCARASEENERSNLLATSQAPTRTDLYSDADLVKQFPYLPVLKSSIDSAVPRPKAVKYGDVTAAIQENAYAALTGAKSTDAALKDLQTKLEELVK